MMDKKYIEEIQKKISELLPVEKRHNKTLLFVDCCSELSRLVASWINEKDKSSHQIILKGNDVCNTNKSHEIFASIENDNIYLIDPTIWQFFPNESSILVGEYFSLSEAITAATNKYGGDWQEREEVRGSSSMDEEKWLKMVKYNIEESLNENTKP